jgi:hypothetical protein
MPSNQNTKPASPTAQPPGAPPQEAAAAPSAARAAGPSPELRAALTAAHGAPSADELWQIHRHALGQDAGQATATLAEAPDAIRRAYYAMARYVAQRFGAAPADRPEHLPDDVIDEVSRLLAVPGDLPPIG